MTAKFSSKFVKTARRSALDDSFLDKFMLMYLNVDVLRKLITLLLLVGHF